MAERIGDMNEQAELQPPLLHFDPRALQGADSEQRRIGLYFFKIAANGD